ncbi:hypothetical protein Tco_0655956 [Tanacetum coccineum]|uniref:Uncharacterized protein n=1 Tax=Tanacetum coccineum TaxID=301880 RepID=A0ABQ4X7F8_9ASTR
MVVLMLCYFIRIMDPTSSLGRICLGENVYGSPCEKVDGHGNWDALEYTDTAGSKEKKVTKVLSFYKMEMDKVSETYIAPCFMNGLDAYDGEINLALDENLISNEYTVKLCLDYEVKKGNKVVKKELIVALRGELYFVKFIINPKEDDVEPRVILGRSFMRLVNGIVDFSSGVITVYHEQDPFIDDYEKIEKRKSSRNKKRAMENLNLFYQDIGTSSSTEEVRPVLETMTYNDKYKKVHNEIWKDKVGVTNLIAKFLILDIPIDRDAPIVVGRGFLFTIGGIVNTPERLFLTFDGICHQTFRATRSDVLRTAESDSDDEEEYEIKIKKFGAPIVWKKVVSFLGSLPVPLQHVDWKPDYKCCYTNEEEAKGQWRTEIRLWEETMMKPDHQDSNALDNSKPWRRYCFHKFTINSYYGKVATKMKSLELYHEFYSTNEFDEICADDELQTKKIIKFRLGGRAHNLTLLEFTRRLGLYHADELDEEGFNVYFQGGLRSDEHFNAQEYWLSISREENLSLSRSQASIIRNPVLRVLHKMTTYGLCQRTTRYGKIQKNDLWLLSMFDARHQNGYANVAWLIARWMKSKGAGTQKESMICYGQFITKLARKESVLSDEVLRSLSALIYCRDLDTTTLRELIDFEGRLIPKDPQPGVPRVAIPIPPRASMYAGTFEHMAKQYPPQPPQYQQQHDDEDEDDM